MCRVGLTALSNLFFDLDSSSRVGGLSCAENGLYMAAKHHKSSGTCVCGGGVVALGHFVCAAPSVVVIGF